MSALTAAVVMARGLGTRMRAEGAASELTAEQAAAAADGAKAMMPLGGRPFLDHTLTELADAGITDVCLIIGPEHQAVRDYYDSLGAQRLTISYAVQERPLGTANAVAAAEEWAGDRRFLVINGDNFYPASVIEALAAVDGNAVAGFDRAALIAGSNIPAERVAAFALVEASEGWLTSFVEKPGADLVAAAGPHALVNMNCLAFTSAIFDACRHIEPSPRGEYEIGDAVLVVAHDAGVRVVPVEAGTLDLASRDDVASVAAALAGREVRL